MTLLLFDTTEWPVSALCSREWFNMSFCLTYEELAVELEVDVALIWGFLDWSRVTVHTHRRLFDVALGHHVVPTLVVQRNRSLHANLQRPVSNIEGENHFGRHWKRSTGILLFFAYLLNRVLNNGLLLSRLLHWSTSVSLWRLSIFLWKLSKFLTWKFR